MNTKLIIENSETKIVLTANNSFEADLLDKLFNHVRIEYNYHTAICGDYSMGDSKGKNHRIEISIKEIK